MIGITQTLTIALITIGLFFLTAGTLGLLRLPNVYNRMHATTKATTLGTASMFMAASLNFGAGAGLTSLIGILFLFMTAPTGAHLLSRAAHTMGVNFVHGVEWPTMHTEKEGLRRKRKLKEMLEASKNS